MKIVPRAGRSASLNSWIPLAGALLAGAAATPVQAAEIDAATQPQARSLERSAEAVPVIRLGPLEFGMSIEQIQAAVPGADWQITSRSRFTGRAFGIVAADALEFGGRRMEVRAREEKYDRDFVLTSRSTEASAQACEHAGMTMLSALEGSAGTLQSRKDPAGETVAFGKASTALFTAFDARSRPVPRKRLPNAQVDRMGLSARREADRLEVKGTVTYDERSSGNCVCSITVIGWREMPPHAVMPYDESKVVRRMPIGSRHLLASRLQLAADEVVVPQQCQVSRQSGAVLLCQHGAAAVADADIRAAAGRYAGAMAFDMSGLDRDDPQPVLIEIPVRVARSDVRPLSFAGPVLRLADIEFDAAPSHKDIQQAYPYQALRDGVSAQVEAVCQVQIDGSLVCRPPAVRQSGGSSSFGTAFERAVEKLLPSYRANPALKNGSPSAGAVFGMAVSFKVAE